MTDIDYLNEELGRVHDFNWELRKMILRLNDPSTVDEMRKLELKYRQLAQPTQPSTEKTEQHRQIFPEHEG